MHERGFWSAGRVQHYQAGEREPGALSSRLRGPDQPDLHLTEHPPQCVSKIL